MKSLSLNEMENVEGGFNWGVAYGCLFVAAAFSVATTPVGGMIAGFACSAITG